MSGGLENDALRIAADKHFANKGNASSSAQSQQKKEMEQMLSQQGHDITSATTQTMIASMQAQQMGGGSEITVLSLPCIANDYIGVSIYCDRNGQVNGCPVNSRISSLAFFCQHKLAIYGDAFIGRYHDDERYEWKRLDFSILDMKSDADWVVQTQNMNRGKNLGSLSTSGQMQKIINNQPGQNEAPPATVFTSTVQQPEIGNSTWSDVGDEVEVMVKLDESVKKSDIEVTIRSTSLQIGIKDPAKDASCLLRDSNTLNALDEKIFKFRGANELMHPVDTSGSNWTIERSKAHGLHLLCSLGKKDEGTTWSELFA